MISYQLYYMQEDNKAKKVVIIGGGLSGLTAAEEILKLQPKVQVMVLQAMGEVGGRTCSVSINDAKFDLGGTWVGPTQKLVKQLAQRANNQLLPQYHTGTKILHIQNKVSTYRTNIPLDVGVIALAHMQYNLWKIDRMAFKLDLENPRNYVLSHQWDSETVKSWMEKNIYFQKVKILFQCAVRGVLGAETDEVSLLFFLWYVRQSGGIERLVNIENGFQEKKMFKGAQELSLFLKRQVLKLGGIVKTKCYIKKVIQQKSGCKIYDSQGNLYEADYLIIAMPPARVNKIQFEPPLSRERRFICERNLMGSITKVILLYDKAYWRENGFSGETVSDCLTTPLYNAYDDCRYKQNGEVQPAMVIFLNASVDRQWSKDRQNALNSILLNLAQYFKSEQMLKPLSVYWKVWNEQRPLYGGPVAFFPPGVLTKIEDIRVPEGRIHWAGTQMARQCQGFMDGAIQSGLRVAKQISERIQKPDQQPRNTKTHTSNGANCWYTKILNQPRKWIEWL